MTYKKSPPDTNGHVDADKLRRMEDLVGNVMSMRREWFNKLLDPRRDLNDECGYPVSMTAEQYQTLYSRDPIAARVVEVMPKECWQVKPSVYEDEDAETITEFEQAVDDLGKSLRVEKSYHEDTAEGNVLWEYCERADIVSGIGQYGIMLLGLDDGRDMREPASPRKGQKLTFLRVFPEALALVARFENDRSSPRYGHPNAYNVTFHDPDIKYAGDGRDIMNQEVHWSRVIHLADTTNTSEVFAFPRMQQVLNRLLDLAKVYGGDAEAFWKNCLAKLILETQPSLGGDVEVDQSSLRDMMEKFGNGMQPWLSLMGMTAKTLPPAVVDPTAHIAVQLEAICIKLGIPMRKFMGSERGELSSGQDEGDWNDKVHARHTGYLTPRMIVPLFDRFINLRVLPTPKSYKIWWPDIAKQTDADKSNVAAVKTTALSTYVSGGVEALIPPLDYLTRILGMDEEEAQSVLEAAEAAMEEKQQEQMVQALMGDMQGGDEPSGNPGELDPMADEAVPPELGV